MADIQKSYLYQMFKAGVFLGVLPKPTTDFAYAQDINSNAVQISVDVPISADVADIPVEPLLDETGNVLLDEAGAILYEERAQDVVGGFNPRALIQEDNNLKVYEISTNNPNGKIVFDGYVEDWTAYIGSSDDKINFTAISKGTDLADYLIEGGATPDQSQATGTDLTAIYLDDKGGGWNYVGESFVVGTGASPLSSVLVKLTPALLAAHNVTVSVYDNSSLTGTPLATATRSIPVGAAAEFTFTFANALVVTAGGTYYFSVTTDAPASDVIYVWYKSATNPYANGTMYNSNYGGGSGGGSWYPVPIGSYASGSDLYFKTYYTAAATSSPYSSTDPSAIVQSIVGIYNNSGGVVTTDPAIVNTGVTVSYTFKVNTILEGIQKCLDLAPANWYWYVDPATNILYFKATPTTPTHKFIKGRHFNEIKIGGSVENVRNVVYFSGGDNGAGVNLFRKYTNAVSLARRRRRLERLSDNRVTVTDTADLIVNNFLNQHDDTDYNSPVSILDGTYDLTTLNVGDTVQLEGFGNFADSLLLQIARNTKYPDRADLQLGVLLQRQSDALIQALNDLDKLQTVDNPSSPS